jgi:acid phosphatase (class A)
VRAVVHGRTKAEDAQAFADSSLAFGIFEPAIGPDFSLEKLPRTAALLKQVKQEIGEIIDTSKNHWKRLRPYQLDPELSVGKPEPSFGYPSGHSTRGTVYALVLAELFPEKRDAILQVGRNIGWDRVIIGKHYPTDIYSGRTLGQAIMRELEGSTAFKHDLAEARAEVQAALEIARRPAPPPKPASLSATAAH